MLHFVLFSLFLCEFVVLICALVLQMLYGINSRDSNAPPQKWNLSHHTYRRTCRLMFSCLSLTLFSLWSYFEKQTCWLWWLALPKFVGKAFKLTALQFIKAIKTIELNFHQLLLVILVSLELWVGVFEVRGSIYNEWQPNGFPSVKVVMREQAREPKLCQEARLLLANLGYNWQHQPMLIYLSSAAAHINRNVPSLPSTNYSKI